MCRTLFLGTHQPTWKCWKMELLNTPTDKEEAKHKGTEKRREEKRRWRCSYHPRRRTCRWWSSQWRRSEIWAHCRCSCQTPASPRAAPVSSPHPSAGQTHTQITISWDESYRNTSQLHQCSSPHLCKVLLRDPSCPLDAELQRSAGVRHICTLDQHPLNQQPVLWRVPDVGLTVTVAVHALQERQPHTWASAHTDTNTCSLSWDTPATLYFKSPKM